MGYSKEEVYDLILKNRQLSHKEFELLQTVLLQLVDLLGYEIVPYGSSDVVKKKSTSAIG